MIPVKDIIPPRSTPLVSLGILVVTGLGLLVQVARGSATPAETAVVAVNMLWLWIFADNVEDRLGHVRFATVVLACYAAGTLARQFVDPGLPPPIRLTTGTVAGVIGAYVVLYPRSRVLMLVPFPLELLEVPAILLASTFVVLQAVGGPASFAEIGAGAVSGALLCLALRRPFVW